jgi:hypothetical protein
MLGDGLAAVLIHYDRARAESQNGGGGERLLSRSVGRRERRVGGSSVGFGFDGRGAAR